MSEPWVSTHISLNGRLIPREQATISIFNQALFASFGVYESIEVDAGVLFHLEDHIERLFESARIVELCVGHRESTIRRWVAELVEKEQITEALLRIMVFGPNGDETLVYILPLPLPHYPSTYYTRGAEAITFQGCRAMPQAKTLNTLVNYLGQRHARSAGAHEAFLVDPDDNLTEGSRSNLFVVDGGQLVTPPADTVLSGITRELVWRLAEGRRLKVVERRVPRAALSYIEEMFVTSTSMHVIPIVRVDGQAINDGRVGPITRLLMSEFEAYYAHAHGRMIVPGPAIG